MTDYTQDIKNAIEVLQRGGVILYPTDTIWGIGCDASNSDAVKRVFDIKHRSDAKALITLVDSVAALERTVESVPDVAYQLIDVSDKPVTIIYDKAAATIAPELKAEDGSIGVRVTKEPFSAQLCRMFRRAIVSTSANVSGEKSPKCFDDISDDIISAVDYVCMSRRDEDVSETAQASTIIKISDGGLFKIIRS